MYLGHIKITLPRLTYYNKVATNNYFFLTLFKSLYSQNRQFRDQA